MNNISKAFIDESQEYFTYEGKINLLTNGISKQITSFPFAFENLLKTELSADKNATRSLNKLNILGESERITKFYDCNYSRYDGNADVTLSGTLGSREFVPCTYREICPYEGLLCKFPKGLTKREAQVARRVALSLSDEEMCSTLFISQHTLRNHKNKIEYKIGQKGKVAIGVWASKNGLI